MEQRTILLISLILSVLVLVESRYKIHRDKYQFRFSTSTTTWLQPEYSGQLISEPGSDAVYIVMFGRRYRVPNTPTFQNLFRRGTKIKKYNKEIVRSIVKGGIISDGAMLATSPNDHGVYMITNGARRQIMTKSAFEKWNFNPERIVVIPDFVLNSIPRNKFIE